MYDTNHMNWLEDQEGEAPCTPTVKPDRYIGLLRISDGNTVDTCLKIGNRPLYSHNMQNYSRNVYPE
jgi:hypothetical protein